MTPYLKLLTRPSLVLLLFVSPSANADIPVLEPGGIGGRTDLVFDPTDFTGVCDPQGNVLTPYVPPADPFADPVPPPSAIPPPNLTECESDLAPSGLLQSGAFVEWTFDGALLSSASVAVHGLPDLRVDGQLVQWTDFDVAPTADGTENVVRANISISTQVRGFLVNVMVGSAAVAVRLRVFDITGVADPDASLADAPLIHTETLFTKKLVGDFGPSVGLGINLGTAGVQVKPEMSFKLAARKEIVNRAAGAGFDVLLQRGHRYRLALELATTVHAGLAGGMSIANFSGGGLNLTSKPPVLANARNWASKLTTLLQQETPKANLFADGIAAAKFKIDQGELVNTQISVLGPDSNSIFNNKEQEFDLKIPSANRSFSLDGDRFALLSDRLASANLPGITNGSLRTKLDELIDWLGHNVPVSELAIQGMGVEIRKLSIVLEEDLREAVAEIDDGIAQLRLLSCDLQRLLHVPQGRRQPGVAVCSDRPGFPWDFPAHPRGAREQFSSRGGGSARLGGVGVGPAAAGEANAPLALTDLAGLLVLERQLLEGRSSPTLYLPAKRGGTIEVIRSLVIDTIDSQFALGIAPRQTEEARQLAALADQRLETQDYPGAFGLYSLAYRRLVATDSGSGSAE